MVNKIALGCVTFGREIDRKSAFSIMDYAMEKGITFWDTAAVYGNGASEKIIGEWISDHTTTGRNITIATKIPPPYNEDALEMNIEKSLQRLQKDCIDILYLHNWHPSAIKKTTIKKLDHLITSGVLKTVGLSNFNDKQLISVLNCCNEYDLQKPGYIQNNHNLAISDLTDNSIRLCREKDIKIVTYSPLGAGFLTGKHITGVIPGSRFDIMPAHQKVYFTQQSLSRLDVLLKLSAESGVEPSKLALAWAFSQAFVSNVLIGVREKTHIDQSIEAANSIIDLRVILAKVEQFIKDNHCPNSIYS